jgi:hypothetical protein
MPDVNVVPVLPPVRKINSKGTAVLNARRDPPESVDFVAGL